MEAPPPPRICVVCPHANVAALLADHAFAALCRNEALWVELRLDLLGLVHVAELQACLVHLDAARCVVTCRGPAARQPLLDAALAAEVALVDVELSALHLGMLQLPAQRRSPVMVSDHFFGPMPADTLLRSRRAMAEARGADVVKQATLPSRVCDMLTLLHQLQDPGSARCPYVGVGMGDVGFFSRVLAARFGSGAPLVYAHADVPGAEVAPGQPSWSSLRDLYGFYHITPTTPVYGVVGSAASTSFSPWVHNQLLHAADLPGVYLPLTVPEGTGEFELFLQEVAPRLGLAGLSVTMPHKPDAARLAHHRSRDAAATGAANTLRRLPGATHWEALNTDGAAAVQALQQALGGPVQGRCILLVGAGGVAHSIGHALRQAGATILVAARRPAAAAALASRLHGHTVAWPLLQAASTAVGLAHVEAAVHCTPVGMAPHPEFAPLQPQSLPARCLVMDTIYNPPQTQLLRRAQAAGLPTLSGTRMFAAQAAAQAKLMYGIVCTVDLVEQLLPV